MQIFDRPVPPPRPPLWRRVPRPPRLRLPRPAVRLPFLVRRPLVWVVATEVIVCCALVGTAWHLVATTAAAAAPAAGLPVIAAPPAPADAPPPVVAQASGAAPSVPGRPGLATGGAFLGGLLDGLNRDQAAFENGEWSALQALSGAMKLYIERVMLPAVEKAESTRGT